MNLKIRLVKQVSGMLDALHHGRDAQKINLPYPVVVSLIMPLEGTMQHEMNRKLSEYLYACMMSGRWKS